MDIETSGMSCFTKIENQNVQIIYCLQKLTQRFVEVSVHFKLIQPNGYRISSNRTSSMLSGYQMSRVLRVSVGGRESAELRFQFRFFLF